MLPIVLAMLLIVLVAAAVVVYVAYPHRGEDLPVLPAIGDAMKRGVGQLPTVDQTEEAAHQDAAQHHTPPVAGAHRAP